MKLSFITYFKNLIWNNLFQNVMGIKIINEIFYLFKCEIWCGFYTYRTFQFSLATFQMLSLSMWLMATPLDCAGRESNSGSPGHNWATLLLFSKVLPRGSSPQCCFQNITEPKVLKCGRLGLKDRVDRVCQSLHRACPSWERWLRERRRWAGLLYKQAHLLPWNSRLAFPS